MRRVTHLTSPALTRGSPSSPPIGVGGEDVFRRAFLFGGASLVLGGCFDRPCHERNPAQKAFLDGLHELAKPALASAVSDAAALAAAARLQRMPTHAGDALAGAIAGDSLTENQKRLLAAVDVDYLHSFRCGCRAQLQRAAAVKFRPPCLPRALAVPACSRRRPALPRITCAPGFPARSFDALAMPAQLLPAYVVSMFLELELAHFGWATVFTHLAATQLECG